MSKPITRIVPITIGFLIGNGIYALLQTPFAWQTMFERDFFQSIAIVVAWFVLKDD